MDERDKFLMELRSDLQILKQGQKHQDEASERIEKEVQRVSLAMFGDGQDASGVQARLAVLESSSSVSARPKKKSSIDVKTFAAYATAVASGIAVGVAKILEFI